MWAERASKIRAKLRDALSDVVGKSALGLRVYKGTWDDIDFGLILEGLGDELVIDEAYEAAAQYGQDAIPDDSRPIDAGKLVDFHTAYRRKYANQVPGRIDAALKDFVQTVAAAAPIDQAELYDRIDQKLDALGGDVTRYADGPWATGQAAYGNALGEWDVRMFWILEDGADHCDTCPELATQSQDADGWLAENVPTWPGMGDTPCLDRCKCAIEAEPASWEDAFEQAA